MEIIYLKTRSALTEKMKENITAGNVVYRVRTNCMCKRLNDIEKYPTSSQRNGVLVLKGDKAIILYIKCALCVEFNNERIEIIKRTFDILSSYNINKTEQKKIFEEITDSLNDYKRPDIKSNKKEKAAYFCVCIAQNAGNLAMLGFSSYKEAAKKIYSNLENALSLLLDEN